MFKRFPIRYSSMVGSRHWVAPLDHIVMGIAGPYSELEYLILAMIGDGITSGYAMRKSMNRMRGGRWSAESGSVYRVLRRLEKDNLVKEARRVGVPNRERTEYELTMQGEALLNSWLTFPPDRSELAFLVDPLRTRGYFLNRLSQPEQLRVVKSWLNESKLFCSDLERDLKATAWPDPLRNAVYFNLLTLAQARHEWLKKLLVQIRAGGTVGDTLETPDEELVAVTSA